MNRALPGIPEHTVDKDLTHKILTGQPITEKQIHPLELESISEYLKILDPFGNLLAVLSHKKESNRYEYCCVFNQN